MGLALKSSTAKNNLFIEVLELSSIGDSDAVKGRDLISGNTISVKLTDTGKYSENDKRKSLKELFNGVPNASNDKTFQLEPGGIVSMKGCTCIKDNEFVAQWANVVRFSPKDADAVLIEKHATFFLNETGGGELLCFRPDMPTGTKAQMIDTINALNNPVFLIKTVESNSVDGFMHKKNYDSETNQSLSAEVIFGDIQKKITGIKEKNPSAEVQIIAAEKFVLPESICKQNRKNFELLEKQFSDGSGDFLSKQCLLKAGGDQNQFVSLIIPFSPQGKGIDPLSLSPTQPKKKLGIKPN